MLTQLKVMFKPTQIAYIKDDCYNKKHSYMPVNPRGPATFENAGLNTIRTVRPSSSSNITRTYVCRYVCTHHPPTTLTQILLFFSNGFFLNIKR